MRRLLSLVAVVLVVACNSVLDIPEAHPKTGISPIPGDDDDTTPGCGNGQKSCNGRCVANDDPATGCGGNSCDACQFAHATATCVNGQCAVGQCADNFGNCNEQANDGCETDLSSTREHCSRCDLGCGGGMKCEGSICKCEADLDCGPAGACGTDDDDRGRCYCSSAQVCPVGSACDGHKCAFTE